MKALHLLLTLVMIYTLQWSTTYHFVNATVPKEIYFKKNSDGLSVDIYNRRLATENWSVVGMAAHPLRDCRYNTSQQCLYCDDVRSNEHYRIKYTLKNKNTSCNLDGRYLNDGRFFTSVSVNVKSDKTHNYTPFGSISALKTYTGTHDGDDIDVAFSTNYCQFTRTIDSFYIYKV